MLSDQLDELNEKYFWQMIGECQDKLDSQWTDADTQVFKSYLIDGRILYLRRWFCCHLCFWQEEICPVFQAKLHCYDKI